MTLERLLKAAKHSHISGHHDPHCYHAWVQGKGYVNDGNACLFDRADYLRQLDRDVQSEIDNLGFAPAYAEPGYNQPKNGVVFANWNRFPQDFDTLLEWAGYAVEWSDEWTTCDECQRAFRTVGDSYGWKPAGRFIEGTGELCIDCAEAVGF